MQFMFIPDWLKFRKVKQYQTAARNQKIKTLILLTWARNQCLLKVKEDLS